MKKLIPVIVLTAIVFSACHKEEEANPSLQKQIIGNWLVVADDYNPSVVEWGIFYVGSVKLYDDKSFKVNLGNQVDDVNAPRHGTWALTKHGKAILFYTHVEDSGKVFTDTTEFKIALDGNEKLILEDNGYKILHKKQSN
jgi:hypothetical protein